MYPPHLAANDIPEILHILCQNFRDERQTSLSLGVNLNRRLFNSCPLFPPPRFRKDRPSAVGEIRVHVCRRVTEGNPFQFEDVGKRLCTTFDPDTFRNFFCTSVLLTVSVACCCRGGFAERM